MTNIVWDETGKRIYEIGIDRGVLYLMGVIGVPWNGLVSLEETSKESTNSVYVDGIKISDVYSSQNFEGTLTAFTYPDEFLKYQGIDLFPKSGMEFFDQNVFTFGLSYRTLVGNDSLGIAYGYQIHLLYNLLAVNQDRDYETLSDSSNPLLFSWSLSSTPEQVDTYEPTSHVVFDSRYISADRLRFIEELLYGSDDKESVIKSAWVEDFNGTTNVINPAEMINNNNSSSIITPMEVVYDESVAVLPSLKELMLFIPPFEPKLLTLNDETGFALAEDGYGDVTKTAFDGLYLRLPLSRLTLKFREKYYIIPSA